MPTWITCFFLASLLTLTPASQPAPTEPADAFLASWKRAFANPAESHRAWDAFIKNHPDHELAAVASLRTGIDLLRTGAAAERVLPYLAVASDRENKPIAQTPSLPGFVEHAAMGLMARMAMQKLADSLQNYYRRHVKYPPSLEELVKQDFAKASDVIDPFGQPFAYDVSPRRTMPDIPRQTYVLRCERTKATHTSFRSDLRRSREPIKRIKISRLRPQQQVAYVRFDRPDGAPGASMRWQVGRKIKDLQLWAVTDRFMIVAWQQFPHLIEPVKSPTAPRR